MSFHAQIWSIPAALFPPWVCIRCTYSMVISRISALSSFLLPCSRQTDRRTERQTDRQTERQTDRQTDRQRDEQDTRCQQMTDYTPVQEQSGTYQQSPTTTTHKYIKPQLGMSLDATCKMTLTLLPPFNLRIACSLVLESWAGQGTGWYDPASSSQWSCGNPSSSAGSQHTLINKHLYVFTSTAYSVRGILLTNQISGRQGFSNFDWSVWIIAQRTNLKFTVRELHSKHMYCLYMNASPVPRYFHPACIFAL